MRGRWTRIAIASAVLVAVNLLGRLAVRLFLPAGEDPLLAGLWAVFAIVLTSSVIAFLWTRQRRVPLVVADLLAVVALTAVLVTLVGPLVSGGLDADLPLGGTLLQLLLAVVLLSVGAAAGLLTAVAFGLDPTSRAWRRMATQPAGPRRGITTAPGRPGRAGARASATRVGAAKPGSAKVGTGRAQGKAGAAKAGAAKAGAAETGAAKAGAAETGAGNAETGAGHAETGRAETGKATTRRRGRAARRASAAVPVASGATRVDLEELLAAEELPDGVLPPDGGPDDDRLDGAVPDDGPPGDGPPGDGPPHVGGSAR